MDLALFEHTLKLFPAALATTGGRGEGVGQGRRISKGRELGEKSWVGEKWAEGGGIEGGREGGSGQLKNKSTLIFHSNGTYLGNLPSGVGRGWVSPDWKFLGNS